MEKKRKITNKIVEECAEFAHITTSHARDLLKNFERREKTLFEVKKFITTKGL